MSTHDPESLATAWLEHQKHWWAYEALDGLVASSPSEALVNRPGFSGELRV
jgi:hypothetical protein